jgi:hypothetical protein
MKRKPSDYVGYIRVDDGDWQPVCAAISAGLCWELLVEHKRPAGARSFSRAVLPKGSKPNLRKGWRRKRGS